MITYPARVLAALLVQPPAGRTAGEPLTLTATLFNLARFARWPPSAFVNLDDPILLCVLRPSAPELAAMAELPTRFPSVNGRRIATRILSRAADFPGCHLLFFRPHDEIDIMRVHEMIAGMPVLTVSDTAEFADAGGMIEMQLDVETTRFKLNRSALAGSPVRLSAALLRISQVVHHGATEQ